MQTLLLVRLEQAPVAALGDEQIDFFRRVQMPVRVQPVSTEIGCRKTASENIAPMLTQVISAPAATITQP